MGVATRRYRLEVTLHYIKNKHQQRIYIKINDTAVVLDDSIDVAEGRGFKKQVFVGIRFIHEYCWLVCLWPDDGAAMSEITALTGVPSSASRI